MGGVPGTDGARAAGALVTGAAVGVAATAGSALLLYTGLGLLASTGFLLALALGALAAGLWVGPPVRRSSVPYTRGRWNLAVALFGIAGLYAEAWAESGVLRASSGGRALAALLLVAAPAYGAGALLSALAARERAVRGEEGGGRTALLALAGAAAGALASTLIMIPRMAPAAVFLGSATALALAGLYESVLGASRHAGRGAMQEKVVLVTGVGGEGQVGYAVARAFAAAGARVVVVAFHGDAEALARSIAAAAGAGEVLGAKADLTDAAAVDALVSGIRERFGRLDVVVNAAGGLTTVKPVEATTPEDWDRELARNARTAFLVSRAALPLLRDAHGAIVNFASPAGERAPASLAAYAAGKAAVLALTRALAAEERGRVRVNAIAPVTIDTEQNRQSMPDSDRALWVSREQVAETVLFLAGGGAGGITGETLHLTGGGSA